MGTYGRKYWLSSWCHCSRGGRHHTGLVRRPGDWLSSHRILGASGALLQLLIVSSKYLPVTFSVHRPKGVQSAEGDSVMIHGTKYGTWD